MSNAIKKKLKQKAFQSKSHCPVANKSGDSHKCDLSHGDRPCEQFDREKRLKLYFPAKLRMWAAIKGFSIQLTLSVEPRHMSENVPISIPE